MALVGGGLDVRRRRRAWGWHRPPAAGARGHRSPAGPAFVRWEQGRLAELLVDRGRAADAAEPARTAAEVAAAVGMRRVLRQARTLLV